MNCFKALASFSAKFLVKWGALSAILASLFLAVGVCLFFDWDRVKEFQTLIAAAIATAAAVTTIEIERQRYRAERKSKVLAIRARLVDALSDLTGYCRDVMRMLDGRTRTTTEVPPPSLAINEVKLALEFLNGEITLKLFDLVSFYQVHNSRLSGWLYDRANGTRASRNVAQCMYDCAKLHALLDELYDFARERPGGLKKAPALTQAQMISALRNAVDLHHFVSHEANYAAVVSMIVSKHS